MISCDTLKKPKKTLTMYNDTIKYGITLLM